MKTNQVGAAVLGLAGLATVAIVLQGCATGTNRVIERKIAAESEVVDAATLSAETRQVVLGAKGVDTKKREKIEALESQTNARLAALDAQGLRLRALLIKDLMSADYDEDEVAAIESRLHDLADKGVETLSDSTEQARLLLGHDEDPLDRLIEGSYAGQGSVSY